MKHLKQHRTMRSWALGAAALALALPLVHGQAQSSPEIEELKRQVRELRDELETIKEGPKSDPAAEAMMDKSFFRGSGLKFGFYGEAKYRFPESGSNKFDPHRFVLTPTYEINEFLVFNSELELEHGGIDEVTGAARSRFDGELELEQFFVDVKLNEHFNIRSLGIDLVPVGRVNKFHEPTTFYSTERPEIYREIIPSTWYEPSAGLWGKIAEGWNYQVMVSTGLEEMVAGSATPGVTAAGGMRGARPRLRDANENNLAYSAQVGYHGLPGLRTSASTYITELRGVGNGKTTVALADLEGSYLVPKTGLELRAEVAHWWIEDPRVLQANNNASLIDDVGERMYGWHTELAYHFWPEAWRSGRGREMDLVPFVRYSDIVTQSSLVGAGAYNDNGTANKRFVTLGLAYFLNANFVFKADWRRNLDGTVATENSSANQDYFQLGMGVFF